MCMTLYPRLAQAGHSAKKLKTRTERAGHIELAARSIPEKGESLNPFTTNNARVAKLWHGHQCVVGSERVNLPPYTFYPVIMLNLALFLLSLILFHVDVGWSQNTLPAKSRGQLTKELHDLTIKFDQHLKTDTSAEDIQKMGQVLGETMTAAITSLGDKLGEQLGEALGEQLGEALGDKLTEAIEKLGDKQVDGIQNLEHTLGEKLSDLTQKCQNS
ncbi:hypothetical protein BaRGS_00029653, partial [Batillaria attramentaria]